MLQGEAWLRARSAKSVNPMSRVLQCGAFEVRHIMMATCRRAPAPRVLLAARATNSMTRLGVPTPMGGDGHGSMGGRILRVRQAFK
jgi:hypothetical protein